VWRTLARERSHGCVEVPVFLLTVVSLLLRLLGALFSADLMALAPRDTSPQDAQAVVHASIDAMGGEARLRGIKTLRVEGIGHHYYLDQSERPEGPWIASYEQRTELRDLDGHRLHQTVETKSIQNGTWAGQTTIVADGVAATLRDGAAGPGRSQAVTDAADTFAFEPERLLFTGRAAADLASQPDATLQDVTQRVLRFTSQGKTVRLFINAHTHLPTAVDLAADDGAGVWGEVTRRVLFSYWNIESNGLLYPRQRNVLWNGYPEGELSITALAINPEVAAAAFDIPADVRTAFASRPQGGYRTMKLGDKRETLADGIIQLPGFWNVIFVRQPDGLVIVEAPISSEYSAQVLEDAARRFPGVAIKAVVTTSDAWPHLGGLREYAARGIPIYALDVNRPIIERLLAARYSARPDTLVRTPREVDLRLVSAQTTIGAGDNRLVLHPIRGENGERMVLVDIPGRRLLYTSDEIMHNGPTSPDFFMPAYLADVDAARQRAGIAAPETIVGMHLGPTPWSVIVSTLAKARFQPQGSAQ
jgi:glyoxylase-like metal-dependent hydrolase (beta-lactamase superfamily II)